MSSRGIICPLLLDVDKTVLLGVRQQTSVSSACLRRAAIRRLFQLVMVSIMQFVPDKTGRFGLPTAFQVRLAV